jgi:hypothetical protein
MTNPILDHPCLFKSEAAKLGAASSVVAAGLIALASTSRASEPSSIHIERRGGKVVVTWNGGELQAAATVLGPWSSLTNAASPLTLVSPAQTPVFFRVR